MILEFMWKKFWLDKDVVYSENWGLKSDQKVKQGTVHQIWIKILSRRLFLAENVFRKHILVFSLSVIHFRLLPASLFQN